ncbi:uncharacterized protein PG998_015044 [Apiospora kogelbergensis]|uniref:uncharacterized protein n=1 Tax=Apiospora kogelbergensis TaxID=1337665 RepID=UPI00312E24F6
MANEAGAALGGQWVNPSDILSILLLLGPDTVQKAVAQLSGRAITPAAFSFGWVGYAITALASLFGTGFLMPSTDVPDITLVGAQSGHSRPTRSWVLGRLFRDAHHRATAATRTPGRAADKADETWDALRVSVYRFDEEPRVAHGVPKIDLVWCTGFVVIAVQTVLSILPWILHGDWTPFLIAAVGNVLALGNGSRFAMVILGSKKAGLNLEALATAVDTSHPSILTRATSGVLALCWLALLVTVAGVQEHTWYLLAIGLIGSIQNLYAVGSTRSPGAMGIQLEEVEVFRGKKVIGVLKDVEKAYPLVGTSLVGLFFPGSLRVAEDKEFEFWQGAFQQRYAPNKHGRCVGVAPPEADSLSQGLPEKPTEGGGKNRGGQVLTTGTSDIPAKCLHDR